MTRLAEFLDTFDSSISGSWTNGPGDFDTCVWQSGGLVRASAVTTNAVLGRSSEVHSSDQYSTVTVGTFSGTNCELGAGVRWQGGANEAGYFGFIYGTGAAFDKYIIYEVDNAFGFTELGATGTAANLASGDTITMEAVGSTIRLLTNESGGGETQRLSVSDSTLTNGAPALFIWAESSTANAEITACEGGSVWHDFDDFMVAVGPYASGVANVQPSIIHNHAADDYLLCIAHSAGGEAIALGTANGFSELSNSPSSTGATTSGVRLGIFGQLADSSAESGPVITDPGNHCGALVLVIRHVDGAPTVDVTANNQKASASTSFSISGATTTAANALCIPISGRDTDSAAAAYSGVTNADLSSLAEIFDAGTTQGNGGGLGIFGGIKASAGAVGATTGTVSNSINANYFLAFAPPSAGGPITVNVGLVSETDSVLALTKAKAKSVGLIAETDSVLSLTRNKHKTLGLPTETNSAFGVVWNKVKAVALVTETDSPLGLTKNKTKTIGQLEEVDSVFGVAHSKLRALNLLEETDTAFSLSAGISVSVGLVEETDSPFAVAKLKTKSVGLIAEADSALALAGLKAKSVGLVSETDSAFDVAPSLAQFINVGLVSESDSAFVVGRYKVKGVGMALETDLALSLIPPGPGFEGGGFFGGPNFFGTYGFFGSTNGFFTGQRFF